MPTLVGVTVVGLFEVGKLVGKSELALETGLLGKTVASCSVGTAFVLFIEGEKVFWLVGIIV